jgi:hypothetical protein
MQPVIENGLIGFVIRANGDMFFGQVPSGLKAIYETLKCSGIEAVRVRDCIMYIDDEGKFKEGNQVNKLASILGWVSGGLHPTDCIVGDAVLFGAVSPEGEMTGEDYDCPQNMHNVFMHYTQLTQKAVDFQFEFVRSTLAKSKK